MWSRVETRPLYLDWTVSPTVCEADETADALPTMRIRTGPRALRALQRWESRMEANGDVQQQSSSGVGDGEAVPAVEDVFSCLGISATEESSDAGGVGCSKATPSVPLHAPWCPVKCGVDTSDQQQQKQHDASFPPPPVPCICFSATALPTSWSVNAAWERLFGWSQAELRLQLMRRGSAIISDWYVPESWWALHSLLASHAPGR